MDTTSSDFICKLGYCELKSLDPLDPKKAQQLPNCRYVVERYLTIMKEKPLRMKNKKDIVLNELVGELRCIWIYMNTSTDKTYLGLIAISKFLSPSHSKEIISMYKDYKQFLKDESNRSSELADTCAKLLKK